MEGRTGAGSVANVVDQKAQLMPDLAVKKSFYRSGGAGGRAKLSPDAIDCTGFPAGPHVRDCAGRTSGT